MMSSKATRNTTADELSEIIQNTFVLTKEAKKNYLQNIKVYSREPLIQIAEIITQNEKNAENDFEKMLMEKQIQRKNNARRIQKTAEEDHRKEEMEAERLLKSDF